MGNMDAPLVTIVTPSYNQAEYIGQALRSVENQSYSNIEHIVVDGESDDETIKVLESFENRYNLTWISEQDDGQAAAVNKGFQLANGEIVGWINSDDLYFASTTIESVVTAFGNENVDIVYGDFAEIDSKGRIKTLNLVPNYRRRLLRYRNFIPQMSTFLRRDVVESQKLSTDYRIGLDYEYWQRLCDEEYNFLHTNDILAGFRVHSASKIHKYGREHQLEERKAILEEYGQKDLPTALELWSKRLLLKFPSLYKTFIYRGCEPPVFKNN